MLGAKIEGNQWDSSVGVSLKLSAGVPFLQQAADDGGALSVGPASDRGVNPSQSTKITVLFSTGCHNSSLCYCLYCLCLSMLVCTVQMN